MITSNPQGIIHVPAATFMMGLSHNDFCPPEALERFQEAARPAHEVSVDGYGIDHEPVMAKTVHQYLEEQASTPWILMRPSLTNDLRHILARGQDPVTLLDDHLKSQKKKWKNEGLWEMTPLEVSALVLFKLDLADHLNHCRCKEGVKSKSGQYECDLNWYEATAFCEDHGGRLPTEAEWERVAREAERFGFHIQPNKSDRDGESLAEWTLDWYSEYSPLPLSNPRGPAMGILKVIRNEFDWPPSFRHGISPGERGRAVFRRVRIPHD